MIRKAKAHVQKWWAALVLLVLAIGLSRIYLRVHYASDVLAGLCLGIVWLVISVTVIRRMERWSRREVDPAVLKPDE